MSQPGFDDLVEGSVREAMSRVLGPEVWKAVSFYFDVKTTTRDPKSFEKLMSKLFGVSSKVLQQVIGETLLSKVGSTPDKVKGREFQDWIMIARAKFSSAANITVPKQ